MRKPKFDLDDLIDLKRQQVEISLKRVSIELERVEQDIAAAQSCLSPSGPGAPVFNPRQYSGALIALERQEGVKADLEKQMGDLQVELKRCLTR